MSRIFTTICMILILGVPVIGSLHPVGRQARQGGGTTALSGLPFCALVLRVFVDEANSSTRVYVLMETDNVTEANLRILFERISRQHSSPSSLEATVYTDVDQLAFVATGQAHSGEWDRSSKLRQLAYYRRDAQAELFRFNPDYPAAGLKTVILRGRD
ncbi:MAG: hypothetical protein AABO41_13920 [Acidobacteriota bacterium]